MKASESLMEMAGKLIKDRRFFYAAELEVVGTYLDINITGKHRNDIKVTVYDKKQRRGLLPVTEIYYKILFKKEDEKLTITNKCNYPLSPAKRCRMEIEVPQHMPVKIASNGHANLIITDMREKVALALSETAVNFHNCRDLEVKADKQSKIIVDNIEAEQVKLELSNRSEADILGSKIKTLEAVLDNKSEIECLCSLENAMVNIRRGGKLHIQKIKNSPMIMGDSGYVDDVKIVEIGVE